MSISAIRERKERESSSRKERKKEEEGKKEEVQGLSLVFKLIFASLGAFLR